MHSMRASDEISIRIHALADLHPGKEPAVPLE
jgi:hypothetical protein